MKHSIKILLSTWVLLFFFNSAVAQAPLLFNYQGIARDDNGNPLRNQKMSLKLSVLPSSDAYIAEYEETQAVQTNEFGLYTLQIGKGIVVSGSMKNVQWETGNKYIKVAIDVDGGNNFTDAGTTQLLSVPYAIYADKSGTTLGRTHDKTRTGAVNSNAAHVGADINFITKFTAINTIGKSLLFDNGNSIGIGTSSPGAGTKMHLLSTTGNVEHLRMEHTNPTGFGKFIMYNDNVNNYATFTKYGSAFVGGYPNVASQFPFANLLAFGNNVGPFLLANNGNVGIAVVTGGVTNLKFNANQSSGYLGLGGSFIPSANVHINNSATGDTLRITNATTAHLNTDGLEIRTTGNEAVIMNRENSTLSLGTNNSTNLMMTAAGNTELSGLIKIAGGAPAAGKILTSDATGVANWALPGADSQWVSNGIHIFNNNAGNIGIGTSTPIKKLDVKGDALLNGVTAGLGGGNDSSNTVFGLNSLSANTTGNENTANGMNALLENTSGVSNTAMGKNALRSNTDGFNNSAQGVDALRNNKLGFNNTGSGRSALEDNTNGNNNTASGFFVMRSNTVGNFNTAMGSTALFANLTGDQNTATGFNALKSNTTGDKNTAIGSNTLLSSLNGSHNVALGDSTAALRTAYQNCTFVGYRADASVSGLTNVTAIGANAVVSTSNSLVLGDSNVKVGIGTSAPAAKLDIKGDALINNVRAGRGGGNDTTNTVFGLSALGNNTISGTGNTAVGHRTLSVSTIGDNNTAMGKDALLNNTTGSSNTANGAFALVTNINGLNNTAIGFNALSDNTSGSSNTAIGVLALSNNASGGDNTATGGFALQGNNSGFANTAGGTAALLNNTSGISNTAHGAFALRNNSAGNRNVASGDSAGAKRSAYENCTFVGYRADASVSGLTNATAIGANAIVNTSNSLVLGDGTVKVGIGTSSPTFQLHLSTNSAAKPTSSTWTISSDARLKTVDGNYERGLTDIIKLNTIRYHYNKDNALKLPSDEQGYGFIAQQLKQVYPEAVTENEDGYLCIDLHPVLVSYVNAFKELNTKSETQNAKIELLEKLNAELKIQNQLILKRLEVLENK